MGLNDEDGKSVLAMIMEIIGYGLSWLAAANMDAYDQQVELTYLRTEPKFKPYPVRFHNVSGDRLYYTPSPESPVLGPTMEYMTDEWIDGAAGMVASILEAGGRRIQDYFVYTRVPGSTRYVVARRTEFQGAGTSSGPMQGDFFPHPDGSLILNDSRYADQSQPVDVGSLRSSSDAGLSQSGGATRQCPDSSS